MLCACVNLESLYSVADKRPVNKACVEEEGSVGVGGGGGGGCRESKRDRGSWCGEGVGYRWADLQGTVSWDGLSLIACVCLMDCNEHLEMNLH